MTYDLSNDIGLVRLIIKDKKSVQFDDDDITAFLTLEGGSVKLAAAQALDTIASDHALLYKRIETLELKTDGPATAKALREHAKALRDQVDKADEKALLADEEEGMFEVAEMVNDDFSSREQAYNDSLRSGW